MAWVRLTRPGDLRWHAPYRATEADAVARLGAGFAALNRRHFGGALPAVPIQISGRLRRRLGQITFERATGRPIAITIARRHLAVHDWRDLEETLLHEMVHLWQSVNGHAVDHGPIFRAKARELGVTAAARRTVRAATCGTGDGPAS
jgi:hypothetical protein